MKLIYLTDAIPLCDNIEVNIYIYIYLRLYTTNFTIVINYKVN
jgi:hypothetical protein